MEAFNIILENEERSKLKCELRKIKVNFFFDESTKSLEEKLAYARNHQPSFLRKIFYKNSGDIYK